MTYFYTKRTILDTSVASCIKGLRIIVSIVTYGISNKSVINKVSNFHKNDSSKTEEINEVDKNQTKTN